MIKFNGCYHGHADSFLVQAGSGVATLGLPDSPGTPAGATKDTLVAKYNDIESVKALLKDHDVAAIILEPVVGNSGFIPPTQEFLEELRSLCDGQKTLLVFDEVMTGFRIAYGGAQQHFGVTPVCRGRNQRTTQPTNQAASQPASQPTNQPFTHQYHHLLFLLLRT